MARSEFRWNKKRKHYAYLYKDIGSKRKNILISSKQYVIKHKRGKKRVILRNVPLRRHPNKNKEGKYYLIPKNYVDDMNSFDSIVYKWEWDPSDKRKVKRIKRQK